jgi:uncharacterized BrkB/YihY/UPF0761 family membrane protein
MAYPLYALAAEHPGSALYALSLLVGALPDALALLFQRRGLGRRGGFRTRRRRRSGGLLGALGALALVFVLGPLVLLALAAYAVYRFVGGRRGR